jgi:CubicO group peptidase (beta-lactamase class C family)
MVTAHSFTRTRGVLDHAIAARAFPGAVAEVGRSTGPIWTYATGRLTYAADARAVSPEIIFDLASLTKVLATATIAMMQVSQTELSLDTRVSTLLPAWSTEDRAHVTARDLFEHCAGLPAHRKYFATLAGRSAFEHAICREALCYVPRAQSLYSDLGFMLLGFLLETSGTQSLDEQFARWRTAVGIVDPITFRPPRHWREHTAPTEIDPWRGRLLVGEVHDENAAVLGGISAHAGLFGTAAAVGACARWWLSLLTSHDDRATGVTSSTAAPFAERSSVPGSSRALGWDTMLPTSSCGTRMSARAIGHTGFTGTSLWLDPAEDLYAVLLTNRVHPTRENNQIQPVRRAFHDAIADDLLGAQV